MMDLRCWEIKVGVGLNIVTLYTLYLFALYLRVLVY
jgi:hypothetical protein